MVHFTFSVFVIDGLNKRETFGTPEVSSELILRTSTDDEARDRFSGSV